MTARQDLPSGVARRFRTGRPSLDFCHTGGEGDAARWELLHGPADVARFAGLVLDAEVAGATAADLRRARALRGALWACAQASIAGTPLPPAAVAQLNAAAIDAPLAPLLGTDGTSSYARPATARQALATLARDAIDLLSGPLAGRIRECAADNCGLLFVDASRPGTRRWCSMELCGNRAKLRTHRGNAGS